ncbi:MAG: helix-turn-helix transcriptional regulator [Alphaproteobacteria bacterium]|nr:helix-turn-helix transcriptional regulator [Alphaproteobacteria bacterium]
MTANKYTSINARQIKAARALLDWSQEDLAGASDLSIATIRKIESGSISPRDKTMGAIVTALEDTGAEFFGTSGVRLRDNDTVTIEGDGCFLRFLDEVYHALRKTGGEMLHFYADYKRADEQEYQSLSRMRKDNIKMRFLIEEGDTFIPFPLEEVRWIPTKYFRSNLQIVYGDYVATCFFWDISLSRVAKILIVRNALHAEAMKNAFNFMWDNCRKPSITTAKEIYT